jgi:hypothetical protein
MHTIVAICEGTHMPFKIGACVKFFFTILTFVWENSRMIVSVTAVFLFQFNVLIQTSCGSKRKITIFTTKLGGVDFGFVVGFGLLEVGIGIALGGVAFGVGVGFGLLEVGIGIALGAGSAVSNGFSFVLFARRSFATLSFSFFLFERSSFDSLSRLRSCFRPIVFHDSRQAH